MNRARISVKGASVARKDTVGKTTHAIAVYVAVSALQRIAPFIFMVVIAAVVPVESYGEFAVLVAWNGLFVTILTFGLESSVFRGAFLFRDESAEREYLTTISIFLLVAPVAIAGIVALGLLVFSNELFGTPSLAIALSIIGAGFFVSGSVAPMAILRARQSLRRYTSLALSFVAIQTTVRVVLVLWLDGGALGWGIADLAAGVVLLVLSLVFQKRYLDPRRFSIGRLREPLKVGAGMVPHLLSGWGLNLSDRLVIVAYLGLATAGIYSFAYQIASVGMVLGIELNRAVLPRYGKAILDLSKREGLRSLISLQRLATMAICAGVAAFGPLLARVVAGPDFAEAQIYIPLVEAGMVFYGLYNVPMNVLAVMEARTRFMGLLTGSAAIVNIGLNLVLIPILGGIAAALSTCASYLVLLVAVAYYTRRTTKFAGLLNWSRRDKLNAFMYGGCIAVTLVAQSFNLLGQVSACLVVLVCCVVTAFSVRPAMSAVRVSTEAH